MCQLPGWPVWTSNNMHTVDKSWSPPDQFNSLLLQWTFNSHNSYIVRATCRYRCLITSNQQELKKVVVTKSLIHTWHCNGPYACSLQWNLYKLAATGLAALWRHSVQILDVWLEKDLFLDGQHTYLYTVQDCGEVSWSAINKHELGPH